MEEKQQFGFGAIKSPDDYRDVPLAAILPIPATMPESYFVDVSKLPVWNQMALGACVGHAGGKYGQKMNQAETAQVTPMSARFLYALSKCADGISGEGTYPRITMQQWQKYGCATEATVPNDTTLDHETYVYHRTIANLPAQAFAEALEYAIKSYAFPGITDQELQNAILNTNGCMLMLEVGPEWWTAPNGAGSWAAADILPLRKPSQILGSHEVYLYGYDHVNGKLRLWFFNSWSRDWGMNGVGNFMYEDYAAFLQESVTAVDLPNDWLNHLHDLPKPNTFTHNFQSPLKYGDKGDEVKALQMALYQDGELKVDPSIFGNYLGLTAAAVKAFQLKYNVASPAEIEAIAGKSVGPKTRTALNLLFNK